MGKSISINIETFNIGPHKNLKGDIECNSLEIGIFANNGIGKTFISRAIRLSLQPDIKPEQSNKIITLKENSAFFKLKITSDKELGKNRDLDVQIQKHSIPKISNTTGYIFHVYNCDYVRENLEVSKYKPNGTIEGYILGKEKIDLTKEKAELEKISNDIKSKEAIIKEAVEKAKKEITSLEVRSNTTEYSLLNIEMLFNTSIEIEELETFEALKLKHITLKNMPDNLADVVNLSPIADISFFTEAKQYLIQSFSKSQIADEFKQKIKTKQYFIEEGLKVIGNKKDCPFCEQELTEIAIELIDGYVKYFNDEEALQIKKADDFIKKMKDLQKSYVSLQNSYLLIKTKFDNVKKYLPSEKDNEISELNDPKDLAEDFTVIENLFENKKNNIEQRYAISDFENSFNIVENWIIDSKKKIQGNDVKINILNGKKNNLQYEKLQLKKRLCKGKYNQLKDTLKSTLKDTIDLRSSFELLSEDIKVKQQSEKVLKKDKVIETFKKLLHQFFGTKYSFDEKNFCLKLSDHDLAENAFDVLSEGEKNIVAFCYYLAETHKLIEREDDYQKLFFVIDDPISSMDFHYVYCLTQAIRTLKTSFNLTHSRFLILTHNIEFMSILIRNNIIKYKFIIQNNRVDELKKELVMPYEEHLRDVYDVSVEKKEPCHTTANSCRHILETINKFISPNVEFSSFCDSIEGFSENEFLYSLMHDNSHGGIRVQRPYTPDMIITGCKNVISYINKSFGGQIILLTT